MDVSRLYNFAAPTCAEIDGLLRFCSRYESVYLYGAAENQRYLAKLLETCGHPAAGFAVSPGEELTDGLALPVYRVNEVMAKPRAGIVMGLSEKHYPQVLPIFHAAGFKDYYLMPEQLKHTLTAKLKPRRREETSVEVTLNDHCNLSCQMCAYFSQLAKERFISTPEFKNEMERMGGLFDHVIGEVRLIGGEPLLHQDIALCAEITRRQFPQARIVVLTNSLPLIQNIVGEDTLKCFENNGVEIYISLYPLNIDYGGIKKRVEEYGVPVTLSTDFGQINEEGFLDATGPGTKKMSVKSPFSLSGCADRSGFVSCGYFNNDCTLRYGRFYICPVAAHIGHFNKYFNQNLLLTEEDSLDIYRVNSWHDFAKFSSQRSPFCGYCDIRHRAVHSEWKPSTKQLSEYI
jgi:hypothetical protein